MMGWVVAARQAVLIGLLPPLGGDRSNKVHRPVDDCLQRHDFALERELAGRDPADVKEIVAQADQLAKLPLHDLDGTACSLLIFG